MIRWSQRERGLKFAGDCPEHVKLRAMRLSYPKLLDGERLEIALCDQPFVSVVDTTTRGWLLPFVGFIPDERVAGTVGRVRRDLGAVGGRMAGLFRGRK